MLLLFQIYPVEGNNVFIVDIGDSEKVFIFYAFK